MFSYNARVRYSEVDSRRNLTVPALINYFQDTCVLHSESVGAGLDYIADTGKVWILGAWRIEFIKDIKFMDEIKLSTWPYSFKAFNGYRNLTAENSEGELCARADSVWLLYSLNKNRLIKACGEDTAFYPCEHMLPMERCGRLSLPGEFTGGDAVAVKDDFIDTNGHVNNCRYIQIAMEAFSLNGRLSVLEAEYKMEARPGDIIYPYVYEGDGMVFVSLRDLQGEIFANVKFTLTN